MKQDSTIDIETESAEEEKDYEYMRGEVVLWIATEIIFLTLGELMYTAIALSDTYEKILMCSTWVIGKRAYVTLSIWVKLFMLLFFYRGELTVEVIRDTRLFMARVLWMICFAWVIIALTYPLRSMAPFSLYDLVWGEKVYLIAINNNE